MAEVNKQLEQTIEELKERKDFVAENAQNNVEERVHRLDMTIEALRGYIHLTQRGLISDIDVLDMIALVRINILKNK